VILHVRICAGARRNPRLYRDADEITYPFRMFPHDLLAVLILFASPVALPTPGNVFDR
jgi:hypothetical protein